MARTGLGRIARLGNARELCDDLSTRQRPLAAETQRQELPNVPDIRHLRLDAIEHEAQGIGTCRRRPLAAYGVLETVGQRLSELLDVDRSDVHRVVDRRNVEAVVRRAR